MLDTGQNQDIPDGSFDAFQDFSGFSSEDEEQFKRGTPTTKGVSESALQLLQDEIDGAPDDGIFVVGIHTPSVNESLPPIRRKCQIWSCHMSSRAGPRLFGRCIAARLLKS
jgi:hypothetical protein